MGEVFDACQPGREVGAESVAPRHRGGHGVGAMVWSSSTHTKTFS